MPPLPIVGVVCKTKRQKETAEGCAEKERGRGNFKGGGARVVGTANKASAGPVPSQSRVKGCRVDKTGDFLPSYYTDL